MTRRVSFASIVTVLACCGCSGTVSAAPDAAGGVDATASPDSGSTDAASADAASTGADSALPDAALPDAAATDSSLPDAFVGVDAASATDAGPASGVIVAGCRIFPPDNPWNQDVSGLPLHPRHAEILAMMAPTAALHADWGNWSTDGYGIPWSAGSGAPDAHMTFVDYPDESDMRACGDGSPFCYPIPSSARIEGGPASTPGSGDRHVLYLDTSGAPNDCTLYEMWNTDGYASGVWTASNGAIFHLGTNALRTEGWTSADAAGLPIMPGLVRYDEVAAGEIRHAIRFTVQHALDHHIHPATHDGPTTTTDTPPYGLRVRLRADFDMTGMSPPTQVILRAMQTYGMFFADQGSNWYITGDSDDRWTSSGLLDTIAGEIGGVHGSDFELLDTGPAI